MNPPYVLILGGKSQNESLGNFVENPRLFFEKSYLFFIDFLYASIAPAAISIVS